MSVGARHVLAEGLGYLEAARWHEGRLWFSDIKNRTINTLTPDGVHEAVATLQPRPSGLGFEPDGSLLVVSMEDEKLLRWRDGRFSEVEEIGKYCLHPNDMAVDAEGRAYISQFGYDLFGGGEPVGTGLVVRHPDGRIETCGEDLVFPNGVVLVDDGRTLVTAESFAAPHTRLSAFDVAPDGSLTRRRVFAEFGPTETDVVDGICVDVEGGVWVSFPFLGQFRRVLEGGRTTDIIEIPADGGNYCVDSVLGGPEGRTLFMLIADTNVERMGNGWDSSARIEAVEVEVPGPVS